MSARPAVAAATDRIPLTDEQGRPTGISKKVIVCTDNARLYRQPSDGASEPVPPFSIFFRLFTHDKAEQQGDWVRVGDDRGDEGGWLKAAEILDWHTRIVLVPVPPQGDRAFTVEAIAPKRCTVKYTGGIGAGMRILVPVLEKPAQGDGTQYTVGIFAAQAQPAIGPKLPIPHQQELSPNEIRLEIVFVIDTTRGMTPLIQAIREVAARCVEELQRKPDVRKYVRFGLVEYRDCTPGMGFVARLNTTLADVTTFRTKLTELKAAEGGSEDVEEDVVAGLVEAIDNAGWTKNSSKHIVLVGDASAHLPPSPRATTGRDIDWLITKAQRRTGSQAQRQLGTVNFHAIQAIQPGAPEDQKRCGQQFRQLAGNGGHFTGLFLQCNPTEDAEIRKVVDTLSKMLSLGFDGRVKSHTPGPLPSDARAGENPQIVKALWNIEQAAGTESILPVRHGTASILSRDGQEPVAQLAVLLSHTDARRLEATLQLVCLGKRPSGRQRITALHAVQRALIAAMTGDRVNEDTSLAPLLACLPATTNTLRMNDVDVAAMTAHAFANWWDRLAESRRHLDDMLHKPEWSRVHDRSANPKFAFVLLHELP